MTSLESAMERARKASLPYPEGETSRDAAALQYWRESLLTPFDAADEAFCLAMLRATAVGIIAGSE